MTTHPDMQPLAFLLGTWSGEGTGIYPTIRDFTYGEEVTFSSSGRPFFSYTQRTWSTVDNTPLHAETGYWRMVGAGRVEVMLAHPTGIVEIQEGTVSGSVLTLRSTVLGRSATAKPVRTLHRTFERRDDALHYHVDMEAMDQQLTRHLTAVLHLKR